MQRTIFTWALVVFLVTACTQEETAIVQTPTATPESYNPFLSVEEEKKNSVPVVDGTVVIPTAAPTLRSEPTPTIYPFNSDIFLPREPGAPITSPTPDSPRVLPTPRTDFAQHVVQPGDTLGSIAQQYGIGLEILQQANALPDAEILTVGTTLNIPVPFPGESGPDFKIIPDSELVYGPGSALFDVNAFVRVKNGYLSNYSEDIDGESITGTQIIIRVAQNYSVNPRLLLAILEHQSGWVSKRDPININYPMGLKDGSHDSLYLQATWTANTLNRGFYLWHANAISTWILADGSVVPVSPTINAGTAAVQGYFAELDNSFDWHKDVTLNISAEGRLNNSFFQTYFFLFGNPFDFAVEPLVPLHLDQPDLQLPFEDSDIWSFTGGPHGGWDNGSAWAALDFGPPGEAGGCTGSDVWIVAVADGWIVRTGDGVVIQDLDGDGYEQTGWNIFYMHVEERDRVPPKFYVYAGDRIGHPSCEGGLSNATHLHLSRKYNGNWVAADGSTPFQLDGWISSGSGEEYDGILTKEGVSISAHDGQNEGNQIFR
ncbi:MAG: LysM peptidoglycan-binding domain-containing protein [Anaerolineae bacterium]|nr:LysM peptidoglycan-binding domain-containing protein [Anaerolineae bacterium]